MVCIGDVESVIHITVESKNLPFFIAEGYTLLPGSTCKDKQSKKRKIKLILY